MFLWGLVLAMALSGSGLVAYPFATDFWADRIQNNLEGELAGADTSKGQVAFHQERQVGDAITKLSIPKLKVKNLIVVEGVTGNALRAGAGHYPTTSLPGDPTGNVAIAGHRTGFGQPFRHLERLTEGDKIILTSPFGRFVYEVLPAFDGHRNPWITDAQDWTVIDSRTPEPSLTLTTCDPPGTSTNRLIVRARLASSSSPKS